MIYQEKWNCPNCSKSNPFRQPTIEHDGTTGACTCCGTQAIRHQCESQSSFSTDVWWLPLLTTGISLACPTCSKVYQLSKAVQKSSDAPQWLKDAAVFAGGLAVFVGILKIIDNLTDS